MDRQIAKRLMAAVLALDPLLGEIDSVISEIPDEAERSALKKNLGEILRQANEAFIVPLGRAYPDLAEKD